MSDPSNAGPYTIGLDSSLAAGETTEIRFSEVATGPANKKGYLRKVFGAAGGMDFVFIVNASPELISVETKSGKTFVPSATSQNLSNGPYRSVRVTNEGANSVNNDDSDKIAIEVGNSERGETGFSARDAAQDLVPGLSLGGN